MNYLVCLMWIVIILLLVFLSLYGPAQEQEQDIESEMQDYMEFYADLHANCPECAFTDAEAVQLYDVYRYRESKQLKA